MLYNMNWITKHFPKHKGVSYNVNQMKCYSLTKQSLWQLDMPFICTSSSMDRMACAIGQSVTTSSTDFSFQNLVFWNLFEFSMEKII